MLPFKQYFAQAMAAKEQARTARRRPEIRPSENQRGQTTRGPQECGISLSASSAAQESRYWGNP